MKLLILVIFPLSFATAQYDSYNYRCGDINRAASGRQTYADNKHGKCYQLIDNEMYWNQASSYCKNSNGPAGPGQLATFFDESAFGNVQEWLRSSVRQNGVWIGGNRCSWSPTGFCWMDQYWIPDVITSYFWGPDQPTGRFFYIFPSNCIQLRRTMNFQAATYPCDLFPWFYSFICQYEMLPISTTKTTTTTTSTTTTTTSTSTSMTTTTTTTATITFMSTTEEEVVEYDDDESNSAATTKMSIRALAKLKKLQFDANGEPTSSDGGSDTIQQALDIFVQRLEGNTTSSTAPPTTTSTASTTTSNGGLNGTSLLLIGIFVGFGITFITALTFGIFIWKRQKIHPTIVQVMPAVATTSASKIAIIDQSALNQIDLELDQAALTKKQNKKIGKQQNDIIEQNEQNEKKLQLRPPSYAASSAKSRKPKQSANYKHNEKKKNMPPPYSSISENAI